jgi:LDH2 family malate/lactate/ureidoglycolate dehydrogenase
MYQYDYLFNFTNEVLMKMGCSENASTIISEVSLASELKYHSSHGMIRLKCD